MGYRNAFRERERERDLLAISLGIATVGSKGREREREREAEMYGKTNGEPRRLLFTWKEFGCGPFEEFVNDLKFGFADS